jgi:hypothetical protein
MTVSLLCLTSTYSKYQPEPIPVPSCSIVIVFNYKIKYCSIKILVIKINKLVRFQYHLQRGIRLFYFFQMHH